MLTEVIRHIVFAVLISMKIDIGCMRNACRLVPCKYQNAIGLYNVFWIYV